MDKRKGIIITVFLLLLVGTGTFVFANPSDELEGNERVIDNSGSSNRGGATTSTSTPRPSSTPVMGNDEDMENSTLDPVIPNIGNNPAQNRNNQGGTAQNNDANSQTGVTTPSEVPKIDNNQEEQKIIESVTSLVEQLSYLTSNAKSKNDITSARDLLENEQLLSQINDLKDEAKKQEILHILDEISKILDDETSPVVTGITNKQITNKPVSVTVEDQNNVTVWLDGVKTTLEDLKNIIAEGTHELVIIDEAYNETRITFTIDKTAPTASISYSNQNLTNQDVVVQLINPSEEITIVNNHGASTYTFTKNGTFAFIIEDKAGNQATIKANVHNIDKDAPEMVDLGILNSTALELQKNVAIANKDDVVTVFVSFKEKLANNPKVLLNDTILLEATLEKEENGNYIYTASKPINDTEFQDGIITIQVSDYSDEAGNIGKTLTNADIHNDTYKSVEVVLVPGFEFTDEGSFSDSQIIIKEPEYDHMEICPAAAFGYCFTITEKEYNVPMIGTYTFKLYDKDNNLLKEVEMTYDNVAPTIKAHDENGKNITDKNVLHDSVSIEISGFDDELSFVRVYKDGNEIDSKIYEKYDYSDYKNTFIVGGSYKVVAVDRAGNESVVEFTISNKSALSGSGVGNSN